MKTFSPAEYFHTAPELVNRKFNRLRTDQLATGEVLVNQTHDVKLLHREAAAAASSKSSKSTPRTSVEEAALAQRTTAVVHGLQAKADQSLLAGYSEIAARIDRKRKIQDAVDKLQLEKNLAGKGARVRITPKEDKFGEVDDKKVVYKWKLQRKK